MLGNMDRNIRGDICSGHIDLPEVSEDAGDRCAYISRGTIRRKRTEDIRKEVETNIIQRIKKRLSSQSRNGWPEVVGGIETESGIEANLDVEMGTLDFLLSGDNP